MTAMYTIEITDSQYAAAMLLSKVMYAADKLHGWLKFVEIGGLYLVQP